MVHKKGLCPAVNPVPKKTIYTPGPPVRDKYWMPLGLNFNGKLGEPAFEGTGAGAPDKAWPQIVVGTHTSLCNHRQTTIIARLC